MSSTRFTVLTGHTNQYSLTDVVGILRHQRKSGRLLIEYAPGPAVLYFKDGHLVDAEFGTLAGLQAAVVAFAQPPAAFNFNPLIQPTRFTIEIEQQRVIFELLGCWTEDPIAVTPQSYRPDLLRGDSYRPELQSIDAQLVLPSAPEQNQAALPKAHEVLALSAGSAATPEWFRQRWALALAVFALLFVFGVPTMIAIGRRARQAPAAANAPPTLSVVTPVARVVAGSAATATKTKARATIVPPEQKHEREQSDRHRRENESPAQEPTSRRAPTVPTTTPRAKEPAQSEASKNETPPPAKSKPSASSPQTVKVIMRIENGRVVQATIGERRPNSEAYEALALRIARQRRYPPGVNKQETMLMKVDGPK